MAEQLSPPPASAHGSNLSYKDALSDEEIVLLRKLVQTQKRWWQDYSLLIAGLAFLLSLATSVLSIWTGHIKDIHYQQAQLAQLTQGIQNLILKEPNIRQKYKNSPGILTLIAQQERSLQQDAVAVALGLGSNAPTGELITLAKGSISGGNVPEAKQLLNLAVAAAATPLDESFALRLLGALQIHVGSPEMRAAGNANFQRAVDLESEYPDLRKEAPALELYIKAITEINWARALMPTACKEAQSHVKSAQSYLSGAPVAVRSIAEHQLEENGVAFSGDTVLAPPGCSPTPDR